MERVRITFDGAVKREILDFLDKAVSREGLIIEKQNPEQKVLTFDGQDISIEEFGGVKRGSEVFIKNDLVSLMRLSKEQ